MSCCPFSLPVRWLCISFLLLAKLANAQSPESVDEAYVRVTQERAEKIVKTLNIAQPDLAARTRDLVAQFYQDLSVVHQQNNRALAELKAQGPGDDAAAVAKSKAAIEAIKQSDQSRIHYAFLARLSAELSPEKIELIKDGLTYSVVPKTYAAYLELYPQLNEEQQRQIRAWLLEAREHAMDAGSSDEKHAWFGKYKGKINIYLSKAGFDAKEAERALKAKKAAEAKK